MRKGRKRAARQPVAVATARAATDAAVLAIPEVNDYRLQYKRFKEFVDENAELSSNPHYLTRKNVDAFFDADVRHRDVGLSAMGKILPALTWYSKHREHVGSSEPFVVKSPITEAAMKAQAAYFKSIGGTGNPGQDPHFGLKDNLSTKDRLKIMGHILGVRSNWAQEGFTFTWGHQAAIRGASNRKFVYADLRMSRGYSAEDDGPLSRALLLVLRKGPIHKDRHDKDDQVAVWRHKEYKLCSVFNTAAHILSSLKFDNNIGFLHEDKNIRAAWWDKEIIDLNNKDGTYLDFVQYDVCCRTNSTNRHIVFVTNIFFMVVVSQGNDAMIHIYAATGVINSKVCHHRTAALQYGGFESLGPHQVNTLTKHKLEKQSSAYGPVAERITCKVMAGFKNGEPYHLERGQVVLPHSITMYENMLFGDKFTDWRDEADSEDGDKSTCCFSFLNGLLPWLIEVLVQDGAFFIHDYPTHPLSNWLKNSIPNYENWARETRRLVAIKIAAFGLDRVSALNAASLEAFNTLHRRLDQAEQENKSLKTSIARQDVKMQQILDILQAQQVHFQQVQQPPPPPQHFLPPPQQHQQPLLPVAPQPAVAHRNINETLRNTPRLPPFDKAMPKSMVRILSTWKANNIDSFVNDDQKNWPHNLVLRYEKQHYLMRYIRNTMAATESTEEEAAVTADLLRVELGIKTVDKFLKYLKRNDDSVTTRTYRGRNRQQGQAAVAIRQWQHTGAVGVAVGGAVGVAVGVIQQPPPPPPPPPQDAPPPARRPTYGGRNRQPPVRPPTQDAFGIAFGVIPAPPPPPPPPGQPPGIRRFIVRGDAEPPPGERYNNEYGGGYPRRRNVGQVGFAADTAITSGRRFRDVDDSP